MANVWANFWPENSDFNFPLYTNFPDSENYITDYGRFLHKVPAGSPILEGFLLSYLIYVQIWLNSSVNSRKKSQKSGNKSPEFQNHQTEIIIIIIINDYHYGYIINKLY